MDYTGKVPKSLSFSTANPYRGDVKTNSIDTLINYPTKYTSRAPFKFSIDLPDENERKTVIFPTYLFNRR